MGVIHRDCSCKPWLTCRAAGVAPVAARPEGLPARQGLVVPERGEEQVTARALQGALARWDTRGKGGRVALIECGTPSCGID